MINLILQGGQGNQMFEYATALAIAEEYGLPICIDCSFFETFGKREWCRPYGLDIFRLDEPAYHSRKYSSMVRLLPKVNNWCRKYGVQHLGKYYFELDRLEDIEHRKSIVLFGYFTNVHVFSRHAAAIRKAFTFKNMPDKENYVLMEQMQTCNSVAVHIRRGDYLKAINSGFAKNGVEWYQRAMIKIEEKVSNPHYFFFSDDMTWTKEQFAHTLNATFVDINHGRFSYNDMRLMTCCKHQIIANSTFSWWAAWLNANPTKVVIAPYHYYNNSERNKKNYLDVMIPKEWIVLQ